MTAIIIPRKHYTQPQGRLVAAGGQSLSGMRFLSAGAHTVDALGGATSTFSGGDVFGPLASTSPVGDALAFRGNGSSGGFVEFASVPYIPPPFSGLMLLKKSSLITEALVSFGGASAAKGWKISSRDNARTICLTYGGVADYVISASFFPAVPELIPVVIISQGSTCYAYSPYGKYSRTGLGAAGNPTKPLTMGAAHNGTVYADYSASEIALTALWSRALSEAEAMELIANPWQLFRADPIRFYSLPSGPIIPTLSGLTTSNITSSGARHSLTLTY